MDYQDFLGGIWNCKCLGCALGIGEVNPPGGLIYESDNFVLHQDPEIPIEGFLILSTKEHKKSIIELNDTQRHELIDVMAKAISLLKKYCITNEVTIIQEERSNHLHIWIFPWHEWMSGEFKKGISDIRAINSYAKKNVTESNISKIILTVKKLKENF